MIIIGSLALVTIPIITWYLTRPWAARKHIRRWNNSVLAVSFWEEILFRGVIYWVILAWTKSALLAVLLSSALFGLFHLRNFWWADRRRVVKMCLYAGLVLGPALGAIRYWSGDIYLCILAHYANNYISMRFGEGIPMDEQLAIKRRKRSLYWGKLSL